MSEHREAPQGHCACGNRTESSSGLCPTCISKGWAVYAGSAIPSAAPQEGETPGAQPCTCKDNERCVEDYGRERGWTEPQLAQGYYCKRKRQPPAESGPRPETDRQPPEGQPAERDLVALVQKWRDAAVWEHDDMSNAQSAQTFDQCANELEAALASREVSTTGEADSFAELVAVSQRFHGEIHIGEAVYDTVTAAVRAAFIAGQQSRGFNFRAHLQRQREFSERTFGPGARTAGVVDHIRKELREIEADPSDISEWIDVVILGLDGAWRAGFTPDQIIAVLQAKQAENEARTWPDWRTAPADKAIEHTRESTAPSEPPAPKGAIVNRGGSYYDNKATWAKGVPEPPAPAASSGAAPQEPRIWMTGGKDRPLTDIEVDAYLEAYKPDPDAAAKVERIKQRLQELQRQADAIERGAAPPESPTPAAPHPLACQNTECGHSRIAHGKYDRCTKCACRHFESTPAAEGQE